MGGSCFVLFFIWYEKVKVSKGVGGGYWFGVGRVGGMFVGGGGGYILENILYRIFGVERFLRFCEVGRNRKG